MPGAQLTGQESDDFLGKVKIKVGLVNSEFAGKAHFVERDEATHRAVVEGRGKEARGTGNAAAVVTLQLHEAGDQTRVTVETDLKIVGKLAAGETPAPEEVVATPATPGAEALGAPAATPTATAAPRIAPAPEPEPIDLLQLAGGTAVTKYAAAGVAAFVLLILIVLLRRRRTD